MKRSKLNPSYTPWRLALFTPGFLAYIAIIILPIFLCLYYSFFDWDGIREHLNFVGFRNYLRALDNREFKQSLSVTFYYAVPGTLIVNALGILFAVLLNKKGGLTNIYRAIFFFPMLVSAVAIGFIWKSLLSYKGIVNVLLNLMNLNSIDFLGKMDSAPLAVLFVTIWQATGFVTVLYLAGLQAIPSDLYDAAKIDGANSLQQFIHITFPWLAPSFTACILFMFTGYMRLYDIVYVLTTGGPGRATETIAMQVIRVAFNRNRFSYASALAIYMLIIVSVLTVFMTYYLRKREEKLLM